LLSKHRLAIGHGAGRPWRCVTRFCCDLIGIVLAEK